MPEAVIPDQYTQQIPRFVLPPEATGEKPPAEPAKPPEAPAAPAAPAAEAKPESAPETPPKAEVEATPEEKETTGKDPDKATTRRFERRIDRAVRAKAEAQARAELLERELQELRQRQSGTEKPVEGAPRMEDFTDVAEYEKAVRAHERKAATEEFERKRREESTVAEQNAARQHWESQVDDGMTKYDDFYEVVGDLKPGIAAWSDAIMEAENAADIAYYLGTHEKEAERIIALSPKKQFLEVGKLSMTLSQKPAAPRKPSKTPAPIEPVSGVAQGIEPAVTDPMPFEQYMKIGAKMFRGK